MASEGTLNGSIGGSIVMEQAIDWHLRMADCGADAWRAFVVWLEADPAHADAYDRLTIEDAALSAPLVESVAPPVVVQGPWRSRAARMTGWATGLAAVAAVGLAILPGAVPQADPYSIETAPGVQREVVLADGTRIAMNGGTRIALDRADPRIATLDRGEAIFQVRHDAKHPFEVMSGGVRLRDIGTVFNVRRDGPTLDVAVAEGAVLYRPDKEAVLLKRGATLSMRDDRDRILLDRTDVAGVGGWRQGRLDFRGVPLDRVAGDVRRATGIDLAVAPAIAQTAFTGTLRTDRPKDEVVATLAALSASVAQRSGRGWVITPRKVGAP